MSTAQPISDQELLQSLAREYPWCDDAGNPLWFVFTDHPHEAFRVTAIHAGLGEVCANMESSRTLLTRRLSDFSDPTQFTVFREGSDGRPAQPLWLNGAPWLQPKIDRHN